MPQLRESNDEESAFSQARGAVGNDADARLGDELDRYLDELGANMTALPDDERASELAEIRAHLEALIDAHKELGDDDRTALSRALTQFGHARRVARGLNDAHRRPAIRRARAVTGAAIVTLALSAGAAAVRESVRQASIVHRTDGVTIRVDQASLYAVEALAPVVIGVTLGALFPRLAARPLIVLAAVVANALLFADTLSLFGFLVSQGNTAYTLAISPAFLSVALYRLLNAALWIALGLGANDWTNRFVQRRRALRRVSS